jgi:hypothetical protein
MQGNQCKYSILHVMPDSQIFQAKVLTPSQNLSLLEGMHIESSFTSAENVNNSRLTGECEGKSLDTSAKKKSYGYLQNGCEKCISVGYLNPD